MWLVFALLGPVFWAIVHVLDRHCVEQVFDRPWMGVITSALTSTLVFLALPFALPWVEWALPSAGVVAIALLAGACIQLSQVFYFQALDNSEAGIVAAYWNLVPTLLPVVSFLAFGKVLARWHYLGIVILIVTSVCFCLIDTNLSSRWQSFRLMLAASILQVVAILLEKTVFEAGTFFVGFVLVTTGIIATGTAPLLISRVRRVFLNNLTTLRPALPMIVGIEVANLVALFMSQRAVDLGIPSLVAAVEATVPAWTFVLAVVLITLVPRFGESEARNRLALKIAFVGIMACGVWLLSLERLPSFGPVSAPRSARSIPVPSVDPGALVSTPLP